MKKLANRFKCWKSLPTKCVKRSANSNWTKKELSERRFNLIRTDREASKTLRATWKTTRGKPWFSVIRLLRWSAKRLTLSNRWKLDLRKEIAPT